MHAAVGTRDADELPHNRLTAAFERRVGRVLARHVDADRPLVVAVSGGPDSTALLVAAVRSRTGGGATVAAYFDHRMRPASETARDRAYVRELGTALRVAVRVGSARTGASLGSEVAARNARYRWLARACSAAGADVCVTGHTLDDQAETVLLRLTRGTGLAGAAGMSERADWPVAAASPRTTALALVRPLLAVARDEVIEYIDALELQPRDDETNELLRFDRNRVRQRALPELRRVNPRAAIQLAHFADLARADDEALTAWALAVVDRHGSFEPGVARLARRPLRELPSAVASRVLRLAAVRIGLRLDRAHVLQLHAISGRRGAYATLRGGSVLTTDGDIELRRTAAVGRKREVSDAEGHREI